MHLKKRSTATKEEIYNRSSTAPALPANFQCTGIVLTTSAAPVLTTSVALTLASMLSDIFRSEKFYLPSHQCGHTNRFVECNWFFLEYYSYTVRNVRIFTKFLCYKGNVKFDDIYNVFWEKIAVKKGTLLLRWVSSPGPFDCRSNALSTKLRRFYKNFLIEFL